MTRNRLTMTLAGSVVSAIAAAALAGCGGGGGGTAAGLTKAAAKTHALQAARSIRNSVSLAAMGGRLTAMVATRSVRRDAQTPDPTTGYFYSSTTNADGSTTVSLFTDAALTVSAGTVQISAPTWTGGVSGTFPATYKLTWNVTAGQFSGVKGTMSITVTSADGRHELVHEALSDAVGETETADLTDDNGTVGGTQQTQLADGSNEHSTITAGSGSTSSTAAVTFDDGSQGTATEKSDGSVDATVQGQATSGGGTVAATVSTTATGGDQVQYSDGSQSTGSSLQTDN